MHTDKFSDFVEIVKKLRKECPWDKEQTNESIKAATLEEAYEALEAIDKNDYEELKYELGDLLFHIVFHSVMAEEKNKFNIDEVIKSIQDKLIRRHPHVFSTVEVENSEDVKRNWETIKLDEGRSSVLEGVPVNLPSLLRAHRLQEKAAKVGFDWEKKEDVWKKVIEEIEEMHEAEQVKSKNSNVKSQRSEVRDQKSDDGSDEELHKQLEGEIGDVFFALVNYSRFLGVNPETALMLTNEKFIKRFSYVEKKINESGKKITESNLAEMDVYWEESKKV